MGPKTLYSVLLFSAAVLTPLAGSAIQIRVEATHSLNRFSYAVFNDEPASSSLYISDFHLTFDAPITVSATPTGWAYETDGSTYVDWSSTDETPPYASDIGPQESLVFSIDTPVISQELLYYSASAWDHAADDAGPVAEGMIAAPVRMLGDFELDNDVDGGDLLAWQRAFSSDSSEADATQDGIVNADDLELWRVNYGAAALPSGALAIPEPNSLTLAGSLVILLATGRLSRGTAIV